jgi:hypothetical protein
MRVRTAAAAALTVGLIPLLAAPAHAGVGFGQLIATPTAVGPGQTVTLQGTCPNNGAALAGIVSSAFVGGTASITQGNARQFHATATIGTGASGTFTVSAVCGAGSPSTTIEVSGAGVAAPTSSNAVPGPASTTADVPGTTTTARHGDTPSQQNGAQGGSQRNPSSDPVKNTPAGTTSSPTGKVSAKAVDTKLAASATSSNTPLWLGAGSFLVAAAGVGVLLTRRRIRRPTGR